MAIDIKCRCGWGNSFDDGQEGMTLVCPECSREIYVTTNAAEFANRNIGDDDFAFATEDDDGPVIPDGSSPAPTDASASQRKGARPRRGSRRGQDKQPWEYDRKSAARGRAARVPQSRSAQPFIIVGIMVVLVGVGWMIVSSMDRADGIEKASGVADQVAESLRKQHFTAARDYCVSRKVIDKIQDGFEEDADPEMRFESKRIKTVAGEEKTYNAVYRFDHGDNAFRLSLHLEPSPKQWKVVRGSFRAMTPGEL